MYREKRVAGIILMGGEGLRFNDPTPKQFHSLGGKRVFEWALETFQATGVFDEIILVCHEHWRPENIETNLIRTTLGGKTRQSSSYQGLKALQSKPDIVLIHDGVRPFVTEKILIENIEAAIQYGAADTCIPSTDTLVHAPDRRGISSIPQREEFLRGQTPQTFRTDWIVEAHVKALADGVENVSDDCTLVLRLKKPVQVVMGEEKNIKITSPLDLFLAEQILLRSYTQVP